MNLKAETPVPTDSVRRVWQADREPSSDPPDRDNQESLEKLGPAPQSSQRPFNFISHLYFPDFLPREERDRGLAHQPEFLIKLPPELLVKHRDIISLYCFLKGVPAPFVIWLHNGLNVEDSVSHSLKHHGPLCCLSFQNVGPGQGPSYIGNNANSAWDAECSKGMKGWHLHALVLPLARPSAHDSPPFTLLPPHTAQGHTQQKDL